MANIYRWPSSISSPIVDGYTESGEDGLIWTTVEAGAKKVRPRYSAVPTTVSGTVILHSQAQKQVLDDFYWITLNRVGEFYWKDYSKPLVIDNIPIYRFTSRPSYTPVTGGIWQASIALEMLTKVNGRFLLDFYDDTVWPTT